MARHTTTATGLDAPVEPLAGSVEQVMFRSEETGCYSNSNFGLVRGLRLSIAPSMAKVIPP